MKTTLLVQFALMLALQQSAHAQFWVDLNDNYGGMRTTAVNEQNEVFIGTWGYGVFRSSDLGSTWTSCNSGLTELFTNQVLPGSNGYLYACNYDGVFRSEDNGNSWTTINSGMELNQITYCLEESSDNVLYAGNALGLFRSVNFGDEWTQVTAYEQSQTSSILAIETSPMGKIFFGTSGEGLYFSDDGGTTFNQRWIGGNQYPVTSIKVVSENVIYATTCYNGAEVGDGIFRSEDGGDTWEPMNNGLGELAVWNIEFIGDQEFYCGTYHEGIYHTTDGGLTWTPLSDGLTNLNVMDFARGGDGYLYAATNGGLHRSVNPLVNVAEQLQHASGAIPFPNPCSSRIKLQLNVLSREKGALVVYNEMGQIAYTCSISDSSSQVSFEWSVDFWPNGMYFYEWHTSLEKGSGNFIVQH
jgi:photosystem II stability/assembly factor-like uncharacterized protein